MFFQFIYGDNPREKSGLHGPPVIFFLHCCQITLHFYVRLVRSIEEPIRSEVHWNKIISRWNLKKKLTWHPDFHRCSSSEYKCGQQTQKAAFVAS